MNITSGRTILRLEQIHHYSRNYEILNSVDFNLFTGEIHALVGNHLSGKTTIGRIIAGSEKIQDGSLYVKGKKVLNHSVKRALKLGIGMVYQTQNLVSSLNSVDNIFFGNHPSFFITKKSKQQMREKSQELLARFECNIDLDQPLYRLNELDKQIINICRVLVLKPDILILDEIGENMPPDKLGITFKVLRELSREGTAIIYITSNFKEVFKIADRVTILNEGYRKATEKIEALDPMRLINLAFETPATNGEPPDDPIKFMDSYQESIIDALPIGEILVNSNLEVVFANTQARTLLKFLGPRGQLAGLDRVFNLLDDDKFYQLVYTIDRGESLTLTGERFMNQFLKIVASPIQNQKKQKIGSNIFIEDVSFDYQTREYLMQAKKAENTAALAAGVAHEIKNPLGIMQNYIELLKLGKMSPENQSYLHSIEKELIRITKIVGNLLSYSREIKTPYQHIKIIDLLQEILLLLEHKFSSKEIVVVKDFKDDPVVFGDENKLKQLFMNLLINAIEAVLEEGFIGIYVTTDQKKQIVHISIKDNGFGISETAIDKIFSPFFTTKVTRTNIGLGLSICQNIVESHKGVIKFTSIPRKHTTFTITFPLSEATDQYEGPSSSS
ncbi:MAG: ATP-binding protein [Sphaerochaetaceae bacterium]|nr:ATP-binding protein [Sphaerochaetaceae bacterium]